MGSRTGGGARWEAEPATQRWSPGGGRAAEERGGAAEL